MTKQGQYLYKRNGGWNYRDNSLYIYGGGVLCVWFVRGIT